MVDRESGGVAIVLKVEEEFPELGGVKHSLVDNGPGGKGGNVEVFQSGLGCPFFADLSKQEQPAFEFFEVPADGSFYEQLADFGTGLQGFFAQAGGVDRHIPPSDSGDFEFRGDLIDERDAFRGGIRVLPGEKEHSYAQFVRRFRRVSEFFGDF
jgi:hypothetical protein